LFHVFLFNGCLSPPYKGCPETQARRIRLKDEINIGDWYFISVPKFDADSERKNFYRFTRSTSPPSWKT